MGKDNHIAEARTAEQELGRLKKIFDATPDVVVTFGPDLRLLDLNEIGRRLMGWAPDEDMSEKTLSAFFNSREYARIVNQGVPAAVEAGAWRVESTLATASENAIPVALVILAHKSEHGELEFLTLVARDLIEIQSTMDRLKASEQRLLLSQRIAGVGSWEVDYGNNQITVSDETCRIFEVDPQEFKWSILSTLDMVHPKDRDRVHQTYDDCVQNQVDYQLEYRLLLRNGKIKHVKAIGIMETDESGRVIRSIGTIQDITELSLLQQDLLLKAHAIESHIDAIAMATPDGNLVYVNQAVIDLWGEKRKEDVLGRSVTSFWVDADEALGVIKELRSKDSWSGEMKAKRRDGSTFYALLSVNVTRNPDGEITRHIASLSDITNRKKAEEFLKKAEREYRLLVEHQEDLICRWLADSTLTFANQSYCRFFGKTHDQLMGRKWLSFLPEDAQDNITRYYQDLARNPRVNRMEHQAISSDGKPCWQEWIDTPIFDSQGRLREFQSIGRDITHRRQLEEYIRNQAELFSKILQTTSEAYWFGKGNRILDVNEAACSMLGYTREEMLNLPISDIDIYDSEEGVKRREREILETGYGLIETRHRKKDGSIIDVECRVVTWVSNEDTYFVGFARDVTEVKRALEYKKELEVLQRSHNVKSQILGLFRHELLTPMNAILGFSRMLSDDPELAGRHREKAEIVNQGASRLVRTLNNIISMADMDARAVEIDNAGFDLFELLEEVGLFIRPLCKAKGLGMTMELDPRTPWSVIGDRGKFRQVLENLLEHSLRFTDQGGVALRVWKEEAADEVLDDGTPARIMFEVEDSGAGIAEERRSEMFKPSTYNHGAGKPDRLGLGLVIAREYIRMMGGDIRVESRAGKGSRYCFDILLQCVPGDKLDDACRNGRIQRTAGFAQRLHDSAVSAAETASGLPRELRAKLRQAVEEGDMELFSELLERVKESRPGLAGRLRKLALAFDYKSLRVLLAEEGRDNED